MPLLRGRSRTEIPERLEGPGLQFIGVFGITCLATVLFLISALAVYSLVQLWPTPNSANSTPGGVPSAWLWWSGQLSNETKLFIIVLAAGGLGGLAHAVRSLYWYVGNRRLRGSWSLMYLSLPATGAGIALLTYLLLRGGLTTSFSNSDEVNPYGVAAISALAGLFAREAIEKMKAVFTTLLAPAEKGKDSLGGARIVSFSPHESQVGGQLLIEGSGLNMVTYVKFGSGAIVAVDPTSDSKIGLPVPTGAATGPLEVIGPFGSDVSADTFTVIEVPAEPDG
jgi:hypothetical protein